ncbi:MAG: glutathione S-transferase family protein [Sneathiella sp.]
MGLLQDGVWVDKWYDTKESSGRFVRKQSSFRNWITADGAKGPSGEAGFQAEAGRYHLYISHACPWAHRAMIFRAIKGLESMIDVSVVHWYMAENGWTFQTDDKALGDQLFGSELLHQVYTAAQKDYTGRVTVPVLWDKKQKTIVSNESSEIIRMFNSAFDEIGALPGDYYPEHLRSDIDPLNDRIYDTLNNGVYKCGFATTQTAYDEALKPLFDTLNSLEEILSNQRYLVGDQVTEADFRLFTTLVRFDPVYVGHFKCNLKRIADFPNLSNYVRDLYQHPGVAPTVHLDHIKKHYYGSHETINPTLIVPGGPEIDYSMSHDRDRF